MVHARDLGSLSDSEIGNLLVTDESGEKTGSARRASRTDADNLESWSKEAHQHLDSFGMERTRICREHKDGPEILASLARALRGQPTATDLKQIFLVIDLTAMPSGVLVFQSNYLNWAYASRRSRALRRRLVTDAAVALCGKLLALGHRGFDTGQESVSGSAMGATIRRRLGQGHLLEVGVATPAKDSS